MLQLLYCWTYLLYCCPTDSSSTASCTTTRQVPVATTQPSEAGEVGYIHIQQQYHGTCTYGDASSFSSLSMLLLYVVYSSILFNILTVPTIHSKKILSRVPLDPCSLIAEAAGSRLDEASDLICSLPCLSRLPSPPSLPVCFVASHRQRTRSKKMCSWQHHQQIDSK